MTAYHEYFFGSAPAVAQLELMEITHPRFSQVFRIVRNTDQDELTELDAAGNNKRGVIVLHEGGDGPYEYEYLPVAITKIGTGNDLDQILKVDIGDLGSVIPAQIDLARAGNDMRIKPEVRYRVYRSDDTTETGLIFGPTIHEITTITRSKSGCSFEAVSPRLGITRTGKRYTTVRFPMMKAFFRTQ
jgi:hypothetical protein